MVNDDGNENNNEFAERRNRPNSPNYEVFEHGQRRHVLARLQPLQNHFQPLLPQPHPPPPARFILEVYQPILLQAQIPLHLRIMPIPFSLPLSPPLTPPPPPLPSPSPPLPLPVSPPPPPSPQLPAASSPPQQHPRQRHPSQRLQREPPPALFPRPPPIAISIPINIRPLGVPLIYMHSFWLRIRESWHLQNNASFQNKLLKSSERRQRLASPFISKVHNRKLKRFKICSSKFVSKYQKTTSTFLKSPSVSSPAADSNNHQNYDTEVSKPRTTAKETQYQPQWHMTNYKGENQRLRKRKCNCKMMLVDLEVLHDKMNPPQVENIIEAEEWEGEVDEEDEEDTEEEEDLQLDIFINKKDDDSNDDHNFPAMVLPL